MNHETAYIRQAYKKHFLTEHYCITLCTAASRTRGYNATIFTPITSHRKFTRSVEEYEFFLWSNSFFSHAFEKVETLNDNSLTLCAV